MITKSKDIPILVTAGAVGVRGPLYFGHTITKYGSWAV